MVNIAGHKNKIKLLDKIVNGEKFHHGYLFWGPEYIGKYTIAKLFADKLVNGTKNDDWNIADKADNDIYIINPEHVKNKKKIVIKDISINAIKDANYWIALAPDKNAKVLVINDAHRMTKSAQNALLKTLEEPKENRYIIVVTHNSNNLLQTIQSRCFNMQFSNLANDELESLYDKDEYLIDACGKPGFLNKIHTDEEFCELVKYSREQLQTLSQKQGYERMMLAAELSKKDDEYLQIFLQVWIHRIWTAAHKIEKYELIKFANDVEDVMYKFQFTNANKQLILEDLFINIK